MKWARTSITSIDVLRSAALSSGGFSVFGSSLFGDTCPESLKHFIYLLLGFFSK